MFVKVSSLALMYPLSFRSNPLIRLFVSGIEPIAINKPLILIISLLFSSIPVKKLSPIILVTLEFKIISIFGFCFNSSTIDSIL